MSAPKTDVYRMENNVLGQRLWAVLLTGIPYSIFKIGGGIVAAQDVNRLLGMAMIAWGGIDMVLNLVSLAAPRPVAPCLLANAGRLLDRHRGHRGHEQQTLALDTLAAFSIVASMIWFHRIDQLPPALVRFWEVAVIANILAAGLQQVWRSINQNRQAPAN